MAGKGSFAVSAAAADAAIKTQRSESAAAAKLAEDARDGATTEKERKLEKEIAAKLPEAILSELLGEVSFGVFKRTYQSVWKQIADKRHLSAGRLVFETQLAGVPFVVRSLTQREQHALTAYQPTPLNLGGTSQEHAAKSLEYNARRIVVQVVSVDAMTFPTYRLSAETRAAWEADSAVQQAYDLVMDWDPMLINHVLGLLSDLDQAKYFALVENLRNP